MTILEALAKDIEKSVGHEVPDLVDKLKEFFSGTPYLDSLQDGSAFKNLPTENEDGTWTVKQTN